MSIKDNVVFLDHCDTMTGQEERIASGQAQISPRERTNRLMESFRNNMVPNISSQRAYWFTQGMRENEFRPRNLQWAYGLKSVMENIPVEIYDDELIVGTAGGSGRYALVYPELRGGFFKTGLRNLNNVSGSWHVSDEDRDILENEVVPYWEGKTCHEYYLNILPPETRDFIYGDDDYGSKGMLVDEANCASGLNWSSNYKIVLDRGLDAIISDAEKRMSDIRKDLSHNQYDKLPFLQAAIVALRAINRFAERYAEKAEEMAQEETDQVRKAELEQIAKNCRQVPAKPARTFWEGVQANWFMQLAYRFEMINSGSIGLNRFDQDMNELYVNDLKNGTITESKALEILECLWLKIADIVQFNPTSGSNYWEGYAHFEGLTIGGQTRNGEDATNEMSYLILKSKTEFPFQYPEVAVRLHSGTPDKFMNAVAELIKQGFGFPKMFNDEAIIPMCMSHGASIEDARDYAEAGCTEVRMTNLDTYMPNGGYVGLPFALEAAMDDGWVKFGNQTQKLVDMPVKSDEIFTYDDLMKNLKVAVDYIMEQSTKRGAACEIAYKDKLAAPILSSLHRACWNAMEDVYQPNISGAIYQDCGNHNVIGFGTVVESLAAMKKLIFEDGVLTMDTLKKALDANFEGYEPIRQLLLNAPKYGNNDRYADNIAKEFDAMLMESAHQFTTPYNQILVKHVPVTSHVQMGGKLGATPNGRKAGEAMSEGISPTQGTDHEGPIATLTSIRNAQSNLYNMCQARLLNLKLTPQAVAGEKGRRDLVNLLRSWVDLKLWHLQIGVVSKETLIEAQKNPEPYRSLIVRVAGYSAYFTDLSYPLQTEIINRTAHEMV